MNKNLKMLAFFCLALTVQSNAQKSAELWTDAIKSKEISENRNWMPDKYRLLSLDLNGFKKVLSAAPIERTQLAKSNPLTIELPMPDGGIQKFRVYETHIMHPELGKAFPFIKTFAGQGIDDAAATIIMDYTQFGFHGFILSPNGVVYIDPVDLNNTSTYLIYYRKDIGHSPEFNCLVNEDKILNQTESVLRNGGNSVHTTGDWLSTYRLALACTGEYATYYGGTVAGALAGMVTSVNRVDGIYEKELAISLELIPNDTLLIYTNPNTDGFSNGSPGNLLSENQFKCHSIIGDANYDIGHVFSTAGGGLAGLGVVCNDNSKASGETGLNDPIGDAYDVDYVAHEMGHQFAGNHTFNSQTGSCGGNGNHNTAYEPGSGITIMAYAGICGSDDMASHSIPTFHTISYDEICTYTITGDGALCPVVTSTGNNAPTVNPPGNFIIPFKTPFRLEATGSDPDGDTVYFSWEQFDHNNSFGAWNNPTGNAPIFRSYNPTISGLRYFPKLLNVINNIDSKGELKPSYARTMHFRCTVRDNKVGGGGVTYNIPTVSVQAVNTGTGFAVTNPNTSGIIWQAYAQQTVTWDVAQSDVAPISTPTVNILLSIDGGFNYPYTLATGIPNNGSTVITVPPGITSSTGRVMIEGAGNIFFDINDTNIIILPGFTGVNSLDLNNEVSVFPNPANDLIQIAMTSNITGTIHFSLIDNTGRIVKNESMNTSTQSNLFTMKLNDVDNGVYFMRIETSAGDVVRKIVKM